MSRTHKSVVRILQLQESGLSGETEIVKVLPGTFGSDKEAYESLQESGNYIFLPVHQLNVTKEEAKPNSDGTQG